VHRRIRPKPEAVDKDGGTDVRARVVYIPAHLGKEPYKYFFVCV
jgi:hypothetical protein